jgi:type II secretion system protein N
MTWLKWLAFVGVTGVWSMAVFALTWSFTFPSDAFSEYASWKLQEASKKEKALSADELRPYLPYFGLGGIGITGTNVVLYNRDRPRRGEPGAVHPILHADALSMRAGWLNVPRMLTSGTGSFSGTATLSGGDLDFDVSIGSKDDKPTLTAINLESTGYPISAVPISVGSLEGTGGVDIHVNLDAPEGLSKSDGTIAINGASIEIDRLLLDALGGADAGVKIKLSEADLAMDVASGKAKVTAGHIVTDIATIDIEGDVVLQDDPMNSRLKLKFIITLNEGPMGTIIGGLLGKDAKWEDGKYHYALSGNLKNAHPRPERERRARAAGNRRQGKQDNGDEPGFDGPVNGPRLGPPGPLGGPLGNMPGMPPGPPGGRDLQMPGDDEAAREERMRRREEMAAERRERLRQRREEAGLRPVEDNDINQPEPLDELPPGLEDPEDLQVP